MAGQGSWVLPCLAVIGLFTVIWLLVRWLDGLILRRRTRRRRAPIRVVITVRDRAEWIEGLLRQLMSPLMAGADRDVDWEVIVVDEGSRDDTRSILTRLSRQYPALQPIFHDNGPSDPAPAPVSVLIDLRHEADMAAVQTAVYHLFRS